MRDSYAFVENIKSFPEKIPALQGTIRTLLSQTVECTMFLRECSGHGFGRRVFSPVISFHFLGNTTQKDWRPVHGRIVRSTASCRALLR